MACRNAFRNQIKTNERVIEAVHPQIEKLENTSMTDKLFFGVDSKVKSDVVLQNNLTEFQWVEKNKINPGFWGRNITGENSLTKEEIEFLHRMGCKIAAIYIEPDSKETETQGYMHAKKAIAVARELEIPENTAIFLEIGEDPIDKDYMKGYAQELLFEGYTPGFMVNTDSSFKFDEQFSQGIQTDKDTFEKCLVWAVAPSLNEYDGMTTTHLIHPDNWCPFAPSGITRKDIAIWQYGKNCHPIYDNEDHKTVFNLNLVRNDNVIIKKMF